jgi:tRNA(Ile)-lysidine synthase
VAGSPPLAASRALIARVRATFQARDLLRDAGRIVIGCSGGPDSQALLHVLWSLREEHGCALTAAGVDHGLRAGAGAELDLAADLARSLEIPFIGLRVQVPAGASVQARARDARYASLLACAADQGATRVAVGHTLDDQAETVLARVLRGTGIEGLAAIDPGRADGVIRPFIDAERSLVQAYVRELGLAHASDPSNQDPRFLRVRVRTELLPRLARENPRLNQALAHLADDARDAALALTQQADALLSQARSNVNILREAAGPLRRRALRRWVELALGVVLRRDHIVALERMLWVGGEVRLPGSVSARLDESDGMTFSPIKKRGRGG